MARVVVSQAVVELMVREGQAAAVTAAAEASCEALAAALTAEYAAVAAMGRQVKAARVEVAAGGTAEVQLVRVAELAEVTQVEAADAGAMSSQS